MACQLRTLRRRAFVPLVVLLAFVAVPAVASDIVKCAAKDGTPLYQNFPCNVDSLGSLPSNPSVARAAAQKSKSDSVKVTSPVKPISTGEPRIGMTVDEVTTILGEPQEIIEDEPRSGRVSVWRYADGRVVKFNNKHRVFDVQR